MTSWKYVKAVFRSNRGIEHTFSIVGPNINLKHLVDYLNNVLSDASPDYPWAWVRTIRDEEWHSGCVIWEDGKTIDDMYKDW